MTGVMNLQQQHERYQQARRALWGEPRKRGFKTAVVPVMRIDPPKPKPDPVVADTVVEPKLNRFLPLNQNNEHVIAFRSWQLAEEMGKEYTPREFRKSVDDIILEVLVNYPGITIDDIKGERRTICIMIPRHKAMYEVCRQRPDLSFPQIGLRFGGRDHTTILSAVRKMGAIYGEVR